MKKKSRPSSGSKMRQRRKKKKNVENDGIKSSPRGSTLPPPASQRIERPLGCNTLLEILKKRSVGRVAYSSNLGTTGEGLENQIAPLPGSGRRQHSICNVGRFGFPQWEIGTTHHGRICTMTTSCMLQLSLQQMHTPRCHAHVWEKINHFNHLFL